MAFWIKGKIAGTIAVVSKDHVHGAEVADIAVLENLDGLT